MKFKSLFIISLVVFILLLYNLVCYKAINRSIEKDTSNLVSYYLDIACNHCEPDYHYIMSTNNEDRSINVFVKAKFEDKKDYYRFIVSRENGQYKLLQVNQDIPGYIR